MTISTKVEKSTRKLVLLVVMAAVIFWPLAEIHAESLSELEQQQRDLQAQIDSINKSLSAKQKEVGSYQDIINQIQNQINATNQEIDLENRQISLLNQQITNLGNQITLKQQELDAKKADLGETLRTLYESGNRSTLEILLGSNSLSDVVDQEQNIEAISSSIDSTIASIAQIQESLKTDQAKLQTQQTNLTNTKNSMVEKQRNLSIQRKQQASYLAKSAAEQAQYQVELGSAVAEKNMVSAEIYALRRAQGGYRGGSSAYPFANATPDVPDYWGFYTRECTSYAAWYFNDVEGKPWFNTRPGSGSAWNWPALAADQGYDVSSTPRVGAIASWNRGGIFGQYGHVAIVMAVNPNGTIDVSEYNWIPYAYDERYDVSTAGARFIY